MSDSTAWAALARINYYLSLLRSNDASSMEVCEMIRQTIADVGTEPGLLLRAPSENGTG